MFGRNTTQRLAQWIAAFRGFPVRSKRTEDRRHRTASRPLRVENLEHRTLLSVSGIGNETFKAIPFTASGKTQSSFTSGGYLITLDGTTTFTNGLIAYDSPTHGAIADRGANLSGSGKITAKGKGTGTYSIVGFAHQITDNNGVLVGSVEVTNTTTVPNVGLSFNGTYDLSNATFDTRTFALAMNLTKADGSTLKFNGKLNPTGTDFNVIVTPQWTAEGTINVGVQVPGKPKTTATANRTIPVTNVQLFWAKGTSFNNKLGGALPDRIPIYWNQASGQYVVSDLPSAPAGATHLLFVTQVDKNTRVVALPLPGVSVAATTVVEGNGGQAQAQNHAEFAVTLTRPMANDVTVRYTTVAGTGANAAKPGVDFVATSGSIVIPAGQTRGAIQVPIIGNTKFEPNKNFSVKLTQAQNAVVDSKQGQAAATIVNDDPRPTISIADVSAAEGNSGNKQFVFQVVLSNASYQQVQVKYKTDPGTATAGVDYVSKSLATLSFAPGTTTQTIVVLVKGDTTLEEAETFFVNLSAPVNATIAKGQGVGTILNDDVAAQKSAAARNAALAQFAGRAELASPLELQGRKKDEQEAADSVLALP